MNIPIVFWLVPVASIIALAMAWYFFSNMMKADERTHGFPLHSLLADSLADSVDSLA